MVSAMMFEALLAALLVFVVLNVTQSGGIVGLQAAIAVGSVITIDCGIGHEVTGGSMNPFRSLGPAIVNGPLEEVWPMVAGPFIGTRNTETKQLTTALSPPPPAFGWSRCACSFLLTFCCFFLL